MTRWGVRIAGLIMLVILLAILFNLQRRLIELQRTRGTATATAPVR
jgi:HAMP domain-containing protein